LVKLSLSQSFQAQPKVLVVGGTGFIGEAVCNELSNSGYLVTSAARNHVYDKRWDYTYLDITNAKQRRTVLDQIKPNIVILLAWETRHKIYWEDVSNKYYKESSISFAKDCLEVGVSNLVGIGSMSEYGYNPGKCGGCISFNNAKDLYSKMKIETCDNLEQIISSYGCKGNWIRLFHPYGPGERNERLIPQIIQKMKNGYNLSILNPNHILDFTYIQDVASGIVHIISESFPFRIDVGTGVPTSVKNLVDHIGEILNYPISKVEYTGNIDDERIIYLDGKSEIFSKGWKPKLNLIENLRSYIKLP